MAQISYSVANLSSETREFTLRVGPTLVPKLPTLLVDKKLLPPGGFVHQSPDDDAVGSNRFIRAWAKDSTSEKKLHKQASGVVARVEIRYTATRELVVVARRSDWTELELDDVPDSAGIPVLGDG